MKALTISQPFASLIADGEKWVENRPWQTNYRGPLAIHAGKGTQYLSRADLRRYPTGCIIAVVWLRTCILLDFARECFQEGNVPFEWTRRRLSADDLQRMLSHEHTEGPYCWVLDCVRKLSAPCAYRGRQGLWEIPDDLIPADQLRKAVSGA